jgi:hypothetical protein
MWLDRQIFGPVVMARFVPMNIFQLIFDLVLLALFEDAFWTLDSKVRRQFQLRREINTSKVSNFELRGYSCAFIWADASYRLCSAWSATVLIITRIIPPLVTNLLFSIG